MKLRALILALGLLATMPLVPAWACNDPHADASEADATLQQGYDLDKQGAYGDAEKVFQKVLSSFPQNRKAQYFLANTLWQDNRLADARREWELLYREQSDDEYGIDASDWLKDYGKEAPGATVETLMAATAGFADGVFAQARFKDPTSIAVGPGDTLYVADTGNHRLRRISPDGTVSTLVGGNAPGYADGPIAKARLTAPRGLAIDPVQNVYFLDENRVRFVTRYGLVGTLAGAAEAASRDGDWQTARFDHPTAIAVDKKGNVYVAEGKVPAIRVISPNGDTHLLAGGQSKGYADGQGEAAEFAGITDLEWLPDGNLLVLDAGNARLRELTPKGEVSTLSHCPEHGFTDGALARANFGLLAGAAVDPDGRIFLADAGNHAVRMAAQGWVTTLAGGEAAGAA
ncbi:MAG TPA: tetratricopeptide repeat protein, partial [Oscillatoriaceae cyanobacterium]